MRFTEIILEKPSLSPLNSTDDESTGFSNEKMSIYHDRQKEGREREKNEINL